MDRNVFNDTNPVGSMKLINYILGDGEEWINLENQLSDSIDVTLTCVATGYTPTVYYSSGSSDVKSFPCTSKFNIAGNSAGFVSLIAANGAVGITLKLTPGPPDSGIGPGGIVGIIIGAVALAGLIGGGVYYYKKK